jgi:glycosyltransferase involved in cell wall biosynthesis
MMRILHLSSETTWRGGEQQLAYLMQELNKINVISFAGVKINFALEAYCRTNRLNYFSLEFAGEWDLKTVHSIIKICKEQSIDIIHAHSAHSHTLAVLGSLWGNKKPIVVSRRVDFPINNNFLSGFKYNYRGVKKIICVSEMIHKVIAPRIKNPKRIITIYDGIDLKRCHNSDRNYLKKEFFIANEEKVIGNIAALAPHKDYLTFLETARLIADALPCRFLIVGEGGMRQLIEARIRDLKLQDKVIMAGFRNDIEMILPGLDVLLFTSEMEGLGSTILDAMACNVPVVATDAGGIPEIIVHQKTGMLAAVKDSKQLAAYVLKLLTDADLRKSIIANAKQRVNSFSKEVMAEKTMDVYKEVVQAK